jgi:hypothetical protein
MRTASINVSKIEKKYLFDGKNGKYLDLVFFENRDGKDQYGNDGFVTQGVPKVARDRGERGPILGNWKELEARPGGSRQKAVEARKDDHVMYVDDEDDDEIPFL